jgi:hypothetical protein
MPALFGLRLAQEALGLLLEGRLDGSYGSQEPGLAAEE